MNYKETVFLPRTDFPMRGGLPTKEPQILQSWQDSDLYNKLRAARKDAPAFVLHDGPPYANGQLHIGHALNKILKDVVNRSQSMLIMCPDGIAMACQLNGRSRSNIAKKAKTKTPCRWPSFAKNAAILQRIG